MFNRLKDIADQKDRVFFMASVGGAGIVFIADLLYGFGVFGGVPYILLLVLILGYLRSDALLRLSILCGALAICGFLFKADLTNDLEGLMNRLTAAFAIGAIAMFVRKQAESQLAYIRQEEHLNSVIEKRTEGLRQVVEQLDESKMKLAESEEIGKFGFWEYTPAEQELTWSHGVYAVLGFPLSPKAPSMQDFLDRCHTDDLQILQQSLQYGLAEKKPYTVEYRVVMPDGAIRWIYSQGRAIVDSQGRVQKLVGLVRDISDRKVDQEVSDSHKARFDSMFEKSSVAKALIVPNKRILKANRAFCRWIGYGASELQEMALESLIFEDDRAMDATYAQEIISGNVELFQKEKRFVHRHGHILWALYSVAAVVDEQDRITSFAAEIVDITDRKEAEEGKRNAERVRKALESKIKGQAAMSDDDVRAFAEKEQAVLKAEKHIASKRKTLQQHADALDKREKAIRVAADRLTERERVLDEEIAEMDERREALDLLEASLAASQEAGAVHEEAVSMAEEAVQHLFNLSDEMLCVIGTDGYIKRVSSSFERVLGFASHELEDLAFLESVSVEDRDATKTYLDRLISGTPVRTFKCRHRTKQGASVWLEWNASPDATHEVIYAAARTASPQRKPKAAVDTKASDVRRLANTLPILVRMHDAGGQCIYVNKSGRDFTGLPFEELEGTGWSKGVHPDDFKQFRAHYRSGGSRDAGFQLTYRCRNEERRYRWLQESALPYSEEGGAFKGVLSICIDITALKAATRQFAQALDTALNLADLKSALASCKQEEVTLIVSDAVRQADELIRKAGETDHPQMADVMVAAGQQLLDTINGVLSFSSLGDALPDIMQHAVALDDVLMGASEMLEPVASERGVQLRVDEGGASEHVLTDRMLAHRLVENVMRNVVEHSTTDVTAIEVEHDSEWVHIQLRDAGPLLSPLFLSYVIDNYRGNPDRKGGLLREAGLELALATKLMHLLGGSLTVLQDHDSGTILQLSFPRVPAESEAEPTVPDVQEAESRTSIPVDSPMHSGDGESSSLAMESMRQRVLVAEENRETQRLVRSLLQPYYDLTIVPDSDSALEQSAKRQFDLLLLDIHLNGTRSGIEVLKELRRWPQYHETPAIAVATGASDPQELEKLDAAGFNGFLRKPYSIIELLETVEKMFS